MLLRPQHTIDADEVHVWHLLEQDLTDPAIHHAARVLLSEQETTRMNCFAHERDRTLFLFGAD